MKQLTKEQAIKFVESKLYEDMTSKQIVDMQLFQEKLCMPIGIFMEALNKELKRSVMTHELIDPEGLKKEYLGEKDPPTFDEIMSLIPEKKQIFIKF